MLERSARKRADVRSGVGAAVLLLAAVAGCTRAAPPEVAGPSGSAATTTAPSRPSLWVVVSGTDPDLVRRFAQGLRREPIELFPPFGVALLPEGFVPIRVDAYTMDFSDTNVVEGSEFVSIGISVRDPTVTRDPGTPATVNGHPAEVIADDFSTVVVVNLPDDIELRVTVSAGLNLDVSQVLRLAEGVTVTEHALPWVNP